MTEGIRSDLKERKVGKDLAKNINVCKSFLRNMQARNTNVKKNMMIMV